MAKKKVKVTLQDRSPEAEEGLEHLGLYRFGVALNALGVLFSIVLLCVLSLSIAALYLVEAQVGRLAFLSPIVVHLFVAALFVFIVHKSGKWLYLFAKDPSEFFLHNPNIFLRMRPVVWIVLLSALVLILEKAILKVGTLGHKEALGAIETFKYHIPTLAPLVVLAAVCAVIPEYYSYKRRIKM